MTASAKRILSAFPARRRLRLIWTIGAVADNIAEIDIGLLRVVDYAIGLPTRVTFSVSDDGENYTVVGDMLSPQGLADTVKYDCAVPLSGTIHARYVRIALTGMTAGMAVCRRDRRL